MYRGLQFCGFWLLFCWQAHTCAQLCNTDSNYFTIKNTGGQGNVIINGFADNQNEVIAFGQQGTTGNFVSRFSAQGSLIWSYKYSPDYTRQSFTDYPWYNNVSFTGMSQGNQSTVYFFGYAVEHGRSVNNVETPPFHKIGFILQLDKYGKPLTSEYFGGWYTDYTVNGVLQLPGGARIIYLQSHFSPYKSKILKISATGNILWATAIQPAVPYIAEIPDKPVVMKQLSSGDIVLAREVVRNIADTVNKCPFCFPVILPPPLHYFSFLSVKGTNGNLLWQTNYQCPGSLYTDIPAGYIPEVKNITELPGGRLSFTADMYMPTTPGIYYQQKNYSPRAVTLITDQDGYLKNFFVYRPDGLACHLQSAWQENTNGDQLLSAIDSTGRQLILFRINAGGQITWTKAFTGNYADPLSRSVILKKQNENRFFIFDGNPLSTDFLLHVTNASGNLPCISSSVTMATRDTIWPWPAQRMELISENPEFDFRYSTFKIKQEEYPLAQSITCEYQQTCCKDVIDRQHQHEISLCKGGSYVLPDNTIAKDSGTYYVKLKTIEGCDSIVFYHISHIRPPNELTASPDTCMEKPGTIFLRASGGYQSYSWNGRPAIADSFFAVQGPGIYSVTVQNSCGTKTKTIQVYESCDFPLYLPTAFTPNNDGLNDILYVPALNKNRLVRLTIYDRYGQVVFTTTDAGKGWDGTLRGYPQPSAVYACILEMKGLSGNNLFRKGTVTLIR